MNVLIACEESQSECLAFRALGHNAFSCDLQHCSGGHPEFHILGDALALIDGKCHFVTESGESYYLPYSWDLLIAHPPCTYLSKAGATSMYKSGHLCFDRYEKALAARDFFLKFLNANCDRIAVENPVPLHVVKLPICSQMIQPFWFGDPYTKKTCLWLKNLPFLYPTDLCSSHVSYISVCSRSAKVRSKSFPGISRAMAQQWSNPDTYELQLNFFGG